MPITVGSKQAKEGFRSWYRYLREVEGAGLRERIHGGE